MTLFYQPTTVESEIAHQYSMLLPRDMAAKRQSHKMASDTEVHRKQRSVTEFFHVEKWHPLILNTCWKLMEIKQWMWEHWGGEWRISAVTTLDHLCSCKFLQAFRLLLSLSEQCIANVVDCVEKIVFYIGNFHYQIVLFCFYYCGFHGNK